MSLANIEEGFGVAGAGINRGSSSVRDLATILQEIIDQVNANEVDVATAQATADAGVGVVHRSASIDQATDLVGLGAGVQTFSAPLGAAMAANARYFSHIVGTFTGFDDATHAAYTLEIGSASNPDSVMTALNVAAGQSGFPKRGTAGVEGVLAFGLAAEVYSAKLTGAVDLNTATAGHVDVDLFFFVLA